MATLCIQSYWWLVQAAILLVIGFAFSGVALSRLRAAYYLDKIPLEQQLYQAQVNRSMRAIKGMEFRLSAGRNVSVIGAIACIAMFAMSRPADPRLLWATGIWVVLLIMDSVMVMTMLQRSAVQ